MTREFGATAWGHAWLKMLEPVLTTTEPDRALPRARALARRHITELTIQTNHVSARIADRGREHTIALAIPPWTREEHQTAVRILAQSGPTHSGDLPDHLATELTTAGVRIAPTMEEVAATGDTGPAPRHYVLATCYALVQRVDEEPALAIQLRQPTTTTTSPQPTGPVDLLPLSDIDPRTFYTATAPLHQGATRDNDQS